MILLDTCAFIWIVTGEPLAPSAVEAIEGALAMSERPRLSPISAWEVGLLSSRGRLTTAPSASRWWSKTMAFERFELLPLSAEVLLESTQLPGVPPNDPADRIIAATAREYGLPVMTRDRLLLAYAEAGHMQAIAC